MSGSSTFYATLAGANLREARGWEKKAYQWRAYARQLEQDLATWRTNATSLEKRSLELTKEISGVRNESKIVAENAAQAEAVARKVPSLEAELTAIKKSQSALSDHLDVAEYQVEQRTAVIHEMTETISRYEALIYDLNASVLALSRRLVDGGAGMDFEGLEAAIYAEFGGEAAFNAAVEKEKTPKLSKEIFPPE